MLVEIWSDLVCPWCYLGKRRLERALEGFEHADRVDVVWRSFELEPDAPKVAESRRTLLLSRYGMTAAQAAERDAQMTALAAAEGRGDEREAAAIGITGVPFFVLNRRYAVSGAQPSEILLGALERTWAETVEGAEPPAS